MKLQDKETLSIADAVSDVIEKKTMKEIKYPHKMYSPDGEEVTAKTKEEHEKYSAKGYTHEKPVEESPEEPGAEGEKKFKAKHVTKKSGDTESGKVVKEGKMDVATVTTGATNSPDEPIRKGARRYNVKVVKVHSGRGPMSGVEDLVTFKGKEKDLVKMFSNHFGFDGKDLSDLEDDGDYLVGPGKIYGYTVKESSNEEGEITVSTSKLFVEGPVIYLDEEEPTDIEELTPKQKKYQAFFKKALKKFGVESPTELDDAKRKEFFDYVDKNYDAESE